MQTKTMRTHFIAFFALCALVIGLAVCAPQQAWAEGGDGSGGGGGEDLAFGIAATYPSVDTPYSEKEGTDIWIQFSKSIAQASIVDANTSKVSLKTQDGKEVAAKVWCKDAELEFDYRQYMYITPEEPLDENETYVVEVASGVEAKNGQTMEGTFKMTFRVGEAAMLEYLDGAVEGELKEDSEGNSSETSEETVATPERKWFGLPVPVALTCIILVILALVAGIAVSIYRGQKSFGALQTSHTDISKNNK